MAQAVPPWVWGICIREHGPRSSTARLVLFALRSFMDSNGDAYPSQARIARAACLSEKTVQPIIKALSARGEQWLAVQRHDIPGQAWKRFSYRPCVPDRIDLSKYEDLVAAHVRVNGDVE